MAPVRLTGTVIKVLAALSRAGAEGAYGHEIARAAGVSKTTIYDILARVENARWAISEWETADPTETRRPRRRLYSLTGEGQEIACKAIEDELHALTGGPPAGGWVLRPGHQRP